MKNQEIKFQNKSERYSIFIGENSINLLPNNIKTLCPETKKIGVIVDKNIPSKYKQILKKTVPGVTPEKDIVDVVYNQKQNVVKNGYGY